jgi:hypothetical protein
LRKKPASRIKHTGEQQKYIPSAAAVSVPPRHELDALVRAETLLVLGVEFLAVVRLAEDGGALLGASRLVDAVIIVDRIVVDTIAAHKEALLHRVLAARRISLAFSPSKASTTRIEKP